MSRASTLEGRRLLEACEMYDIGLEMMRTRFRREHPLISADQVDAMVRAWVSDRPYDSPGRPVALPNLVIAIDTHAEAEASAGSIVAAISSPTWPPSEPINRDDEANRTRAQGRLAQPPRRADRPA